MARPSYNASVLSVCGPFSVHTAYHVGQIVYLAKHFAGPHWTTLTIPKGKSAEARGGYKKIG